MKHIVIFLISLVSFGVIFFLLGFSYKIRLGNSFRGSEYFSVVVELNSSSHVISPTNLPNEFLRIDPVLEKRHDFSNRLSFHKMMAEFPWEELTKAPPTSKKYTELSQRLLMDLYPFVVLEPFVPISPKCTAPPDLPKVTIEMCSKHPNGLRSKLRTKPIKIGHAIQLGFDVDVLEIMLNELYDVVDHFFIIESLKIHCAFQKDKILIWDTVKVQPRFRKFLDKVVHFVLDDAEMISHIHLNQGVDWDPERFQERRRWEKFLQWNQETRFFANDDVIGFGDADQIPSRLNIHLIRYCEMSADMIDMGIWFPFGRIDQAFTTDWPVSHNLPYTQGDPSYFTVQKAISRGSASKNLGRSGAYILGGMHMTHYGYLPYLLTKRLTMTECSHLSNGNVEFGDRIASFVRPGKFRELELLTSQVPDDLKNRVKKLVDIPKDMINGIVVLPWFYDCNRERYPMWEGKHDTRLDDEK
jgi:hypothetical protein